MLTHWTNLIRSDCKVVRIGKDYIYPIFKCGSTTLFVNADQILVNTLIRVNTFYYFLYFYIGFAMI